ncbi:MAG: DNA translocase FtsK 4TM domain-containing protein [Bacteroidales bacterium]
MAKAKKKKSSSNKQGKKRKAFGLFRDERFKILMAFLFIAFGLLLLISQLSYLFTWKTDQSIGENIDWTSAEIIVENWAGKTGAYLAYVTMYRWFGLASFAFPFLLVLYGLRLIKIKFLPFGKTLLTTLFITIVLSVWLSYFSESAVVFGSGPGGKHGHYMNLYLTSLLGRIGVFMLLALASFGIVLFAYERSLFHIKTFFSRYFPFLKKRKEAENIQRETGTDQYGSDESEDPSSFDDDLVFETEFPQKERNADTESFSVKSSRTNSGPDDHDEDDVQLTVEEKEYEEEGNFGSHLPLEDYDPTLELSGYKFPTLDLLEKHETGNSTVTNEELISNKNKIVETLGHYKIQIDKIKATIGPTVTLYEIVPAPGVRISKIKNLEDDIALNLSALGIRIIAPIPGKGTIGIEVPNQTPEIVSMRSLINSKKFQESDYDLAIAIGKTISNETYVFDLAKMPHLLVAGATGQGKSVGLNVIIASLLYTKHPAQLKFVLIDPKKVELTLYSKIEKHFLAKIPDSDETIITDTQKVIYTLNSLTIEMDQRYDLLKKAQVRNIKEYNRKFIKRKLNPENGHRYMPYIVVVVDEFADLIMTAGREVETPLARLAQLARAIGIHLVIATQRPTTNIITGVIKANFPARIAFRVTSMIDSRTILDTPGANQLVGRGDMLFAPGSDLIRLQCGFIDIPELEKITDFVGSQQAYPTPLFLPEYIDESAGDGMLDVDLSKRDSLFNDAARLVVAHQQGSTSLIQRKFSIGYNRAGRIIDQLEAAGIVGQFEGSKARQVLFPDEYALEQYLNSLE